MLKRSIKIDRFLLEEIIMRIWELSEDIEYIIEYVEDERDKGKDYISEVIEMLRGIIKITQLKMNWLREVTEILLRYEESEEIVREYINRQIELQKHISNITSMIDREEIEKKRDTYEDELENMKNRHDDLCSDLFEAFELLIQSGKV